MEYIKKVDLLAAAVEVEYLGRPRMMVSVATIGKMPSIEIIRCRECKHWNEEDHWCNIRDSYGWDYKANDFCSYGERSSK